ncbi:MAG: hypothetical protein M1530_04430 [Candidatus Marsarchaeota archaeon]|nr:hypothetical protein [Candidatus Marsarchaeota archaeon]
MDAPILNAKTLGDLIPSANALEKNSQNQQNKIVEKRLVDAQMKSVQERQMDKSVTPIAESVKSDAKAAATLVNEALVQMSYGDSAVIVPPVKAVKEKEQK